MKGHYPDSPASGIHRHAVRVYYEDTDAGGIVYHAAYLRFVERARTEAMRASGASHSAMVREHGRMFVVRHAALDYRRPCRPDDLLCVLTESVGIGGASVTLRQTVAADGDDDDIRVVVTIRLACADIATGRAARIPTTFQAALAALARLPRPI